MKSKHSTREGWLTAAMKEMDQIFFKGSGHKLPRRLQVSCGFPRGSATAIGQCCDPEGSANKTTQMFISPYLGDSVRVLDVLLHEMIHAAVGLDANHSGPFRELALKFGLSGKMTATVVEEGSELHRELKRLSRRLGRYPHAEMQPVFKLPSPKRQGWIRLVSTVEQSYKVVISPRMLEEHGAPIDPWGCEMEPA